MSRSVTRALRLTVNGVREHPNRGPTERARAFLCLSPAYSASSRPRSMASFFEGLCCAPANKGPKEHKSMERLEADFEAGYTINPQKTRSSNPSSASAVVASSGSGMMDPTALRGAVMAPPGARPSKAKPPVGKQEVVVGPTGKAVPAATGASRTADDDYEYEEEYEYAYVEMPAADSAALVSAKLSASAAAKSSSSVAPTGKTMPSSTPKKDKAGGDDDYEYEYDYEYDEAPAQPKTPKA